MALTKKKAKSIAGKARRFFKAIEAGRDNYKRADRLLQEMRAAGLKPGESVVLNAAGDRVRLVDNYAESDKVFRSHGINRFELAIEKAAQ